MIVIPDVNVLVAAAYDLHPFHVASLDWLDGTRARDEHVALLVDTVPGVVRLLCTPPADYEPAEAVGFIEQLLGAGNMSFTRPSHVQMDHFLRFMRSGRLRNKDAHDAMLAGAALDLNATLVTWDTGFSRFPGLRWFRPGERQVVVNPR